jgi:hypothetical protein
VEILKIYLEEKWAHFPQTTSRPGQKDDFCAITVKNADQKYFISNFVVWAPCP